MDPDSKRLRVSVTDLAGRPIRDGGLGAWLVTVAPARAAGEVGVALVSDAEIRALNRRYRRIDSPTDVLAFCGRSRIPDPGSPIPELGDIAIATGVAKRQAQQARHSFQAELRVLALHGLLHLLGYDHDDARERGRMARLETRLLRKGGLRSAVIERARGKPATRRARA